MLSLLKDALISRTANSAVAAQTAVTSAAAIAMAGYENVMGIAHLGTVTSGSVLTLTAYGVATNATSGGTSLGSATHTDAGSDSNKMLVVDVQRCGYDYVYFTLTRTTANAVVDGITAIQYNARSVPVTQGSGVLASTLCAPVG